LSDFDYHTATLDWDTVGDDPLYQHFHAMFTRYFDHDTCELVDTDGLHPFALASKMNSADFPSLKEIFRMAPDERNLWFASMDDEFESLFKQEPLSLFSETMLLLRGSI